MNDDERKIERSRPELFAGKGSGRRCDVCGEPITSDDVEYELEFPDGRILFVHVGCYGEALEQPRIGGGSADAPWTVLFDRRAALTAHTSEVALSDFLVACREAVAAVRDTKLRAKVVHVESRAALDRSRQRVAVALRLSALATLVACP